MNPSEELHTSTAPNGDRIRDRFAVFTNSTMYNRGRDVLLCMVDYNNTVVSTVPRFQLEWKPPGHFDAIVIEPTISGPAGNEFLQSALDAAWEAGLRPKNWKDERPAEVQALNNHLQDFRKLVFGELMPINLPNIRGKTNVD